MQVGASEDRVMTSLLDIAVRSASRAAMKQLSQGRLSPEDGLDGDFRGRSVNRQVTVLAREDWREACSELGVDLPWTTRRANLLIEGVSLFDTAGANLHIGSTVLEITGETEPCPRMEEYHAGLRDALSSRWRGGVCCRVITGGFLNVGAAVDLEGGHG